MNNPPLVDFLFQMAAPSFFSMLFLAALGGLVWAGLAHASGTARGRVFSELMARHFTGLAWPHLVLALAAGAFWVWSLGTRMDWLPGRFLNPPMLLAVAAALAALLTALMVNTGWTRLQSKRPLRMALCAMAGLLALAALYLLLAGLKDVIAAMLGEGEHTLSARALYLPGPSALFWPALAGFVTLALTGGAGLGLVWMAIRRNRDDFGRDYYNHALPSTAGSGLIAGMAFLASQAWLVAALPGDLRSLVLSGPLGIWWGAGLACVLLACLCWLPIARSKAPLRLKGAAFAGLLLLWPAHLLVLAALSAVAPLA